MELGTIKVANMQGETCVTTINNALSKLAGVVSAKASLANQNVAVSFDETVTSLDKLKEAVVASGFNLAVHGEEGNCCGGCGS